MAESVSLTAQAQGAIRAEVSNAIIDVLGPGDPSSSLSSAQDVINLGNALTLKFNKLTKDIQKGLEDVANNIVSAIGNSSQQSAGVASILHGDETESPLNRMASTLDEIHAFLVEKFKPTGLGSEDDNKGMLDRKKSDPKSEEKKEKDTKTSTGSAWLGGTIVAATLMSIKDYLEETWVGLTQRFLKPFVAVQLAIKGLPKSLTRLSLNFQRFTSKIGIWFSKTFPRLSKFINKLITPIKWLTTKVKGLAKSITSAVKNFKFSKFFAPLTRWLSKLGGTAGFGKLFKWMSPIGGLLKKLALPITLVLEAFEAFKMMFVGSFSKNAEAMAESISEKGVIGRAWYGFTHMFQTIAAAASTMWDTVSTTVGILFSDHPDGIMGKITDFFTIISTPIIELFKDFIIYPIQKALSWVPGLGIDDPDDVAAAEEKERAKLGLSYDEEGVMQSSGTGQDVNKSLADHEKRQAERAAKEGLTLPEYKEYVKFIKSGNYKGMRPSGAEWLESKQGKVNQSSALPTPQLDTLRGTRSNRQFSVGSQTATAISITNQVKLPSVAEVINE